MVEMLTMAITRHWKHIQPQMHIFENRKKLEKENTNKEKITDQ